MTLVELARAGSYGAPERSASPRPDREPEKRGIPPVEREPVKVGHPNPAAFAPEAVETWRRAQEAEARRSGTLRANVVGVDASGRVPLGAHDAFFDPPVARPDEHHQFPITFGEGATAVTMYQQGPPVHCPGALPPIAEARRMERHRAEDARQRAELAATLGGVPVEASALSRSQIRRKRRGRR